MTDRALFPFADDAALRGLIQDQRAPAKARQIAELTLRYRRYHKVRAD